MGAAKKIVQLDRKARKPELAEVAKDLESPRTEVIDLAALAKSLTRSQCMTDEQVEACLRAPDRAVQTEAGADQAVEQETQERPSPAGTRRDMSKMALFASVAVVILLLGFYFHLNQNIKTLTQQVQDLSLIKTAVSSLDTKISTMESKVADLETLPAKTRAALMSSILQEMSQKTSYMSTQLESEEQKDKLMRAKELIQQVQAELNTQN
ncbi:MAG: hypothetical protein GXY42_01820 [Desulfovibrionales bacterium]|nr:hypothetical protein [Desulfovibrionales bacterium]